nr:lamin tail domain-containing protein [Haladaptatus sp. DYF46]
MVTERPEEEPIEIVDIRPNQEGDLNNEYVTLQNEGDSEIDMSNFVLSFEGGRSQNYTFGDFSLDASETVTIRNGDGEDTQTTLYTGFDGAVLNNSNPDTVVIANDKGVVLDDDSYQAH